MTALTPAQPAYSEIAADALQPHGYTVQTGPFWCHAVPGSGVTTRPQGWKLHLSVVQPDCARMLDAVLPVLAEADVHFKLVRNASAVSRLNDGYGGLSQIGKFIAVYPDDDAQAVALALALDEVTSHLTGPWIPSDRPLRPGSRVHYRYGTFSARPAVGADGNQLTMLQTPDGAVPDVRHETYVPLRWVADPFLAAGAAQPLPRPSPVIAGRYVVLDTLARSARGAIHLALDAEGPGRTVVLKRAHRHATVALGGTDAIDRLRSEAACLAALQPHPGFPAPEELVADGEDELLVMEDIAGHSLHDELAERRRAGTPVHPAEACEIVAEVADLLAALHRRGWVHRDCKPANLHLRPDGQLVLIDHELTAPPGTYDPSAGSLRGTIGYISPERADYRGSTPADDVYSLGSMLHELLTLEGTNGLPDPWNLAASEASVLDPTLPTPVLDLRTRLLGRSSERPQDGAAAAIALRRTAEAVRDHRVSHDHPLPQLAPDRARAAAELVADHLCGQANRTEGGPWWSVSADDGTPVPPSLYDGSAGTVLALAAAAAKGIPVDDDLLGPAAWRLLRDPLPATPGTAGALYTGPLGVALAAHHAAAALDDPALADAALEVADRAATEPLSNPDMLSGAAGRAFGHLLLNQRTGSDAQLDAAHAAARHLVETGATDGGPRTHADAVGWPIPKGAGVFAGSCFRGYAHGTAGIADALLAVGAAVGDDELVSLGRRALTGLVGAAVAALHDGSGLRWDEPDRDAALQGPIWCFGAPGIALSLQRAVALGLGDGRLRDALAGALASTRGATYMGPTRCHGTAGSVHVLTTAGEDDGRNLAAARHHGLLLTRYLRFDDDGAPRFRCADRALGHGLATGLGGMLLAFLALADPHAADPLIPE